MGCGSSSANEKASSNVKNNNYVETPNKTNTKNTYKSDSNLVEENRQTNSNNVRNDYSKNYSISNSNSNAEIITLGFGDFGSKSTNYFFRELAKEHEILKGSTLKSNSPCVKFTNRFFSERTNGEYKARSIIFDCLNPYLDTLSSDNVGGTFFQKNIINEKNLQNGLYNRNMDKDSHIVLDRIRAEIERCDNLSGLFIVENSSEGIGSGVDSEIIENLNNDYPTIDKIIHNGFYGNQNINAKRLYNRINSFSTLIEHLTMCIDYNVDTLASYASKHNISGENSAYQLMGKFLCDFTSPFRFSAGSEASINKLSRELVSFPRLHFFDATYSVGNNENSVLDGSIIDANNLFGLNYSDIKLESSFAIYRGAFSNNHSIRNYLKKSNNDNYLKYCSDIHKSSICPIESFSGAFSAIRLRNSTNYSKYLFECLKTRETLFSDENFGNVLPDADFKCLQESIDYINGLIDEYEYNIGNFKVLD